MLTREDFVKSALLTALVLTELVATYYVFGLPHGESFEKYVILPAIVLITITELCWRKWVPSLPDRKQSLMKQLVSASSDGGSLMDQPRSYGRQHAILLVVYVVGIFAWWFASYLFGMEQLVVAIVMLTTVFMLYVIRFVLLMQLPKSEH